MFYDFYEIIIFRRWRLAGWMSRGSVGVGIGKMCGCWLVVLCWCDVPEMQRSRCKFLFRAEFHERRQGWILRRSCCWTRMQLMPLQRRYIPGRRRGEKRPSGLMCARGEHGVFRNTVFRIALGDGWSGQSSFPCSQRTDCPSVMRISGQTYRLQLSKKWTITIVAKNLIRLDKR